MDTDPFITIKTPIHVARWSFIIGTVILLAHLGLMLVVPFNNIMVITGFFYVVAAVVINLIVFATTIISSFWHLKYQNQMVINALIQLANIPIAILYFYIVTL
ncbi:hypothetical protein FMM05_03385 [Flavobacterium zepuense]|uniref:Uncharacterized protein n=1 Tax=Flavobacterium zepuense TaxID=2593302 RepID=A0A552V7I9_9FLAO|nr:hypothetical protein [Flavobacterium zepuense]TRW26436.1 hypothetical protein FMM05_03385 [Flavobacterium zepuense]